MKSINFFNDSYHFLNTRYKLSPQALPIVLFFNYYTDVQHVHKVVMK